jgi:hypothetical protein
VDTNFVLGTASLPSPQSSEEDVFDAPSTLSSSDYIPPNASSDVAPTVPISNTRKRRLSDADSQGIPKRPRALLPVGPRLQTVSDPFPMSPAMSESLNPFSWWSEAFEMPEPATTDAFDPSDDLDVGLWCTSNIYAGLSTPGLSPDSECLLSFNNRSALTVEQQLNHRL